MAVTPANTTNLRSKFEQLQMVANSGSATRGRRGYTEATTNATNNATPTQPEGRSRGNTATSENQAVVAPRSPAVTNKPPSQNPATKPTIPIARPTQLPATKAAPPSPFVNRNPIPATKAAVVTGPKKIDEARLEELEKEDTAERSKPKLKPKPDAARQTTVFTKPPVPEVKPQPVSESFKGPTNNTSIDALLASGNEKWRINYDELEFDELVSAGSAGEVYLAYYFGTPVAVKKLFALPPDQKHLVAREFSILQGVNHPNIVQFLGICDHETGVYLITEYVEHGDLFDLLVFSAQPLSWKTKVKIALQVAQAVYYLHSRKIIHRDLKSQNVLIGENMKIKLCDLGLATVTEAAKRLTVCGTNEWMAPEILLQDNYDDKVDVFSFGIVLTELISSQPPKKRDIQKMLAFDVDGFKDSLPPGCPPDFSQLVIDCCKFKSTERPSFKDIVAQLRTLQNELPDDD